MFEKLFARRGLSLDRLRVLCEVAEAGGISRAAESDPVRQSQFSRQLKELEEFFEVELTRRKGKGLILTPAGQELALHARELLKGLGDFQLRWINQPLSYSIGAGESLLEWLLLPNLARAGKDTPGSANFQLRNLRTATIVSGLQDLSLDFGLVRREAVTRPLVTHPLGSIEYALYCPREIIPKGNKHDLLSILQSVPVALPGSDGEFMSDFKEWLTKKRVPVTVKLECDSFPQACRAVRTNRFAAILPTIVSCDLPAGDFVKLDLSLKRGPRRICLAWNPRTLRLHTSAPKVAEFLMDILKF